MSSESNGNTASNYWGSNVCCIVTGASKGIGKEIAISLARSFVDEKTANKQAKARLTFILIAREQRALQNIDSILRAMGKFSLK